MTDEFVDDIYIKRVYGDTCRAHVRFIGFRNMHPNRKIKIWVTEHRPLDDGTIKDKTFPPEILSPWNPPNDTLDPNHDFVVNDCPAMDNGTMIKYSFTSKWAS